MSPHAFILLLLLAAQDARREIVLDTGGPGSFDEQWVNCPCVLYDGDQYRMWYSSVYDSKMGRGGIGLATSQDGIHWQRQNGGEPVLQTGETGAFDDGQVMGPEVHFDGEVYRMWYTGMSRRWHESGFGYYRIGLATSRDGVHWQRANGGKPVLDVGPAGAPDEVQAATPSIIREGNIYRMWYAAWSPEHNHTLCTARSEDGIHWERENGGMPVTGLVPEHSYGPTVARRGDGYLLLFMATGPSTGLHAATSRDGHDWQMLNSDEPFVAPMGQEIRTGHACMLPQGDRWRIWYTAYQRDRQGPAGLKLHIGLTERMNP